MANGALVGLAERAKSLATGFGTYSALGSFALYVLGYLALRFHLTALGVGTDLAVLDERYLFAGANCLVYLASTLPITVLAGALTAALVYGPIRLLPSGAREAVGSACRRWFATPSRATTLGIVVALVVIQLCMRQCFFFANLLVGPGLPNEVPWLTWLVLHDTFMPLYFSGLLLGVLLTGALLAWPLPEGTLVTPGLRLKRILLSVLVAIQALLLPVNYGVLVQGTSLAQVTALGAESLTASDEAWLVWEGKDTITFLVRRHGTARSLVALPRSESKRIEIVGYGKLPDLLRAKTSTQEESNAKP